MWNTVSDTQGNTCIDHAIVFEDDLFPGMGEMIDLKRAKNFFETR
jgi:hypothetical protein